jgi:hypothetical protein
MLGENPLIFLSFNGEQHTPDSGFSAKKMSFSLKILWLIMNFGNKNIEQKTPNIHSSEYLTISILEGAAS